MFAEISGTDIAAIITALGVFVTTAVGAVVTLRNEFRRISTTTHAKIDDVQTEVFTVHTVVDNVQTDVHDVKNTVNGGSLP